MEEAKEVTATPQINQQSAKIKRCNSAFDRLYADKDIKK